MGIIIITGPVRRLLTLLVLIVNPVFIFAQDVIYKSDGTKIEAKVIEVGVEEVKYRPSSNPDGPVYVISRSEIVLIVYQNGEHDLLMQAGGRYERRQAKDDTLAKNERKNLVSINVFDMAFTNLTFSYERIFRKGYVGVKVPLSLGMRALSNETYARNSFINARLWSTGVELNLYPTGQGRVRYFFGPAFAVGQFRYSLSYYYPQQKSAMHYSAVINNGLILQPTQNFNIAFAFGLGLKENIVAPPYEARIEPQATGLFNMGYRF